jgi:sulfhydrogenase subunit beta (sulfur reductase)
MIREDTRILTKARVASFLDALLRDRVVFAPVKREGLLLLESIESARDFTPGNGNTVNSAKDALFPQTERLFTYRNEEMEVRIDVPCPEGKGRVLFGVRPCDARALLLLDGVFGGDRADPYYSNRRSNTVVISLACAHPTSTCFCLSLGGSPSSPEGSDLLLLDLGDKYLVEAHSEQGRTLLGDRSLEDVDDKSLARAAEVRSEAESSMNPVAMGSKALGKELQERLEELFDDPLWRDIAEPCLGCGVCTYLCPTCHCFDICDESSAEAGERIRIWDSCQFPLFTREASGFNPRPSVKERFRQRIMHKFSYLPGNGNLTGCVGCGRCVTECPVNLDIREVLEKVSKDKAE